MDSLFCLCVSITSPSQLPPCPRLRLWPFFPAARSPILSGRPAGGAQGPRVELGCRPEVTRGGLACGVPLLVELPCDLSRHFVRTRSCCGERREGVLWGRLPASASEETVTRAAKAGGRDGVKMQLWLLLWAITLLPPRPKFLPPWRRDCTPFCRPGSKG